MQDISAAQRGQAILALKKRLLKMRAFISVPHPEGGSVGYGPMPNRTDIQWDDHVLAQVLGIDKL